MRAFWRSHFTRAFSRLVVVTPFPEFLCYLCLLCGYKDQLLDFHLIWHLLQRSWPEFLSLLHLGSDRECVDSVGISPSCFCINELLAWRLMFESACQSANVINFVFILLSQLCYRLAKRASPCSTVGESVQKSVWFSQLSSLCSSTVSKWHCWTTSISPFWTQQKIDALDSCFEDVYET